jgi:hypothetical protein
MVRSAGLGLDPAQQARKGQKSIFSVHKTTIKQTDGTLLEANEVNPGRLTIRSSTSDHGGLSPK